MFDAWKFVNLSLTSLLDVCQELTNPHKEPLTRESLWIVRPEITISPAVLTIRGQAPRRLFHWQETTLRKWTRNATGSHFPRNHLMKFSCIHIRFRQERSPVRDRLIMMRDLCEINLTISVKERLLSKMSKSCVKPEKPYRLTFISTSAIL